MIIHQRCRIVPGRGLASTNIPYFTFWKINDMFFDWATDERGPGWPCDCAACGAAMRCLIGRGWLNQDTSSTPPSQHLRSIRDHRNSFPPGQIMEFATANSGYASLLPLHKSDAARRRQCSRWLSFDGGLGGCFFLFLRGPGAGQGVMIKWNRSRAVNTHTQKVIGDRHQRTPP